MARRSPFVAVEVVAVERVRAGTLHPCPHHTHCERGALITFKMPPCESARALILLSPIASTLEAGK